MDANLAALDQNVKDTVRRVYRSSGHAPFGGE